MGLLRKLSNILMGGPGPTGGDVGLYYYVRCKRCGEVIRVRINPMNDLSLSDDEKTRFVRKTIVGQHCYNRIEAEFRYDANRKLIDTEITGGDLVSEKEYKAYQVSQSEASAQTDNKS